MRGSHLVQAGRADPVPAGRGASDAAIGAHHEWTIAPSRGPVPATAPVPARATSDAPPADHRMRRSAPREPDVVQVHIGRIEVRAIVAAPERPGRPRTGPEPVRPLPLDRYLARGGDA
jgi:hypothetical protein